MTPYTPAIAERITTMLVEDFDCTRPQVTPEACLYGDLGFDSLDHVEFVMLLEDKFELDLIPDDEAEQIKTVADAIAAVEKRLQPVAA